jgi:hypothetical protein
LCNSYTITIIKIDKDELEIFFLKNEIHKLWY